MLKCIDDDDNDDDDDDDEVDGETDVTVAAAAAGVEAETWGEQDVTERKTQRVKRHEAVAEMRQDEGNSSKEKVSKNFQVEIVSNL